MKNGGAIGFGRLLRALPLACACVQGCVLDGTRGQEQHPAVQPSGVGGYNLTNDGRLAVPKLQEAVVLPASTAMQRAQ